MVVDWLEDRVYRVRGGAKLMKVAVYDPKSMVLWASGTATEEIGADHLPATTRESMGTHFLWVVVQASMALWDY